MNPDVMIYCQFTLRIGAKPTTKNKPETADKWVESRTVSSKVEE
jgi:hypothetical protein